MILTLAISGYRSIRRLVLPLDRLTIVTGANGVGKSSFYRSLRLLAEVAQGRAIGSLAVEGGLQSTMWAGPEVYSTAMKRGTQPVQGLVRRERIALKLGFASQDYGYAIDLGFPTGLQGSLFNLDPEIKAEAVWTGEVLSRRNVILSRSGPAVTGLSASGRREVLIKALPPYDSMLLYASSQHEFAELMTLRERMRGWRFYDNFRTDREAPARQAHVGTRTPILASDGADLAAAVQTILEIGNADGLEEVIEAAFPGSRLEVHENQGYFELAMYQRGLLRPLRPAELSEGTLRYILLAAALLTPRPPSLMVLNEPETGLYPDLLKPLAQLIAAASIDTQIVVVSHSATLVSALSEQPHSLSIHLEKELGETVVHGSETPSWVWPDR